MKRESGFTLIEIMVAMLIMAGLSLIMAQSVKTGLESRKKVQQQLSEESLIRDAMRLMVSDVGAAFHHRDTTIATYNKVLELRKKKAATPTAPGTVSGGAAVPGAAPVPAAGQVSGGATATAGLAADPLATASPLPIPTQLTGFVGSENAITLTVRNHVRRFVDAKEGDQARVSYYLRNCRSDDTKNPTSSSCLLRMETTIPTNEFPLSPPDEDDAKGVILVHNVTQFKLRYLAAGSTDFLDAWDSTPTGTNAAIRDKFPDAVEITLGIQDVNNRQSKPRLLSWLAPVRSSNNLTDADKEEEAKASGTGTTTGTTGNGTSTGTGTGTTTPQQGQQQ